MKTKQSAKSETTKNARSAKISDAKLKQQLDSLAAKLEQVPDDMSEQSLLRIIEVFCDVTGYSPAECRRQALKDWIEVSAVSRLETWSERLGASPAS